MDDSQLCIDLFGRILASDAFFPTAAEPIERIDLPVVCLDQLAGTRDDPGTGMANFGDAFPRHRVTKHSI